MRDGIIEASFYQDLGFKLEAKRKQCGLSQSDVAILIGVHRNTIMRWEQGYAVDTWHLMRLADVLSINHLLLLPPRQFIWGVDLPRLERERDPIGRRIQAERDPELSAKEVA